MFCIHCGHELDSNNVCHNNSCPSKMNNNSQDQNHYNNNSGFNQNFNRTNSYNYHNHYNCDPNFVDKNGITLSEMTQFIGKNGTSFYIDMWTNNQNNPNFIAWNWPAFFSSWIWLFYRKLNILGAIYLAVNSLAIIFLPIYVYSVILFASSISCALLGNQIYIKHCIKEILSIKSLPINMDINAFYHRLRSSGGTSIAALIIGIIIAVVANVTVSVKYLADNYNDYNNSPNPYNSYPFSDYDGSDSEPDHYSDGGSSSDDPSPGDHEPEAEAGDSFSDGHYSINPGKDASKSTDKTL